MVWDRVLVWVTAVLGLLVVLMPVYTALRFPTAFSWEQAALAVSTGCLAALALALVFTMGFNLLSAALPGLNPFASSAYESIDAGLFSFFVGLAVALAVTCWGQVLFLNSKLGSGLSHASVWPHPLILLAVIVFSTAALVWATR